MENNQGKIRRQVMENSEELQDFLRDLENWEKDIKKKDQELRTSPSEPKKLPPVRKPDQKTKAKDSDQNNETIGPPSTEDVGDDQNKLMDPKSDRKGNKLSSHNLIIEKKHQEKSAEETNARTQTGEEKSKEEMQSSSSEEEEEDDEDEALNEMHLKQKALFDKERGNKFFSDGKYDDAIACYTSGILADPCNAVLPANRAMALIKKGQLAAAEQDCTLSISVDHRYAKAFFRRGTCRLGLRKLALARQDFLKVMELEPDNKFAQIELDKLEAEFRKQDVPRESAAADHQKSLEGSPSQPQLGSNKVEPTSGGGSVKKSSPQPVVKQCPVKTEAEESTAKKPKKTATEETEPKPKKASKFSSLPDQVKPIYKAEHLRSKSTLQKLAIEVRSSDEEMMEELTIPPPAAAQRPTDLPLSTRREVSGSSRTPSTTPAITPIAPQTLPPVPQTAFQFETDWRRLRHWPHLRTQYLRNIAPESLQHLYHQCMETDIFTDVIHCLADISKEDKDAAFSFLKSLTKVGRFSTTVLFLSAEETEIIKSILESASALADSEDLKNVISLYGL